VISGCCSQIVLSTNVAETSLTIDDVTYVVDIGRQREMGFDPNRALACLEVRCRLLDCRWCIT
jgi:ATP-dependent RNA helicase DHX57